MPACGFPIRRRAGQERLAGSPPKCWAVLFLVIATLANITFAGPDPMMDSVEAALTRLGVSLANSESERYNFI